MHATLTNSTALSYMYSHTHIPWHRTEKLMKKTKERFPNMLKSSIRKVSYKNLNFSKWPAAGSDSSNALNFSWTNEIQGSIDFVTRKAEKRIYFSLMDDRTHLITLKWRYITELKLLFSFRLLYEKTTNTFQTERRGNLVHIFWTFCFFL